MPLAFDHVIVLARDLEATSRALFDAHGLAARPGGRHRGHGTANAIVPLGRDYLEIMAVADAGEARGSAVGRWVLAAIERGDTFLALSVRTDDIAVLAARIGSGILNLERARPDGMTLRCRLAGLEAAMGPEHLPFFIQWDVAPEHHPGRDHALHRVEPLGITGVELGGDARRIEPWLGGLLPGLRVAGGVPGVRGVTIRTSAGAIDLRDLPGSAPLGS